LAVIACLLKEKRSPKNQGSTSQRKKERKKKKKKKHINIPNGVGVKDETGASETGGVHEWFAGCFQFLA
jgi:hypothetical protein